MITNVQVNVFFNFIRGKNSKGTDNKHCYNLELPCIVTLRKTTLLKQKFKLNEDNAYTFLAYGVSGNEDVIKHTKVTIRIADHNNHIDFEIKERAATRDGAYITIGKKLSFREEIENFVKDFQSLVNEKKAVFLKTNREHERIKKKLLEIVDKGNLHEIKQLVLIWIDNIIILNKKCIFAEDFLKTFEVRLLRLLHKSPVFFKMKTVNTFAIKNRSKLFTTHYTYYTYFIDLIILLNGFVEKIDDLQKESGLNKETDKLITTHIDAITLLLFRQCDLNGDVENVKKLARYAKTMDQVTLKSYVGELFEMDEAAVESYVEKLFEKVPDDKGKKIIGPTLLP